MELLLIRHALPVRLEATVGPADPELATEGLAQAEALAAWLADEPIDAIYTSPKRRARQTAAPLADRLGLEPVVVDGLTEFDHDATSYIHVEELKAARDDRWDQLVAGLTDDEGLAFRDTVVHTIEGIIAVHAGERVVVSCHGGVVSAYLSHVLGVATPLFFHAEYASITRVLAASTGERSLHTANELAHLRPR